MNENYVADIFSPVFSGATSALCFWSSMTTVLTNFDHMKHLQIPLLRHHDHTPTMFTRFYVIWKSPHRSETCQYDVPGSRVEGFHSRFHWFQFGRWDIPCCGTSNAIGWWGTAGGLRVARGRLGGLEQNVLISKRARNKSDAHPLLACVSQAHSSS